MDANRTSWLNMANPGEKMAYEIMKEARIKAGTLLTSLTPASKK